MVRISCLGYHYGARESFEWYSLGVDRKRCRYGFCRSSVDMQRCNVETVWMNLVRRLAARWTIRKQRLWGTAAKAAGYANRLAEDVLIFTRYRLIAI